MTEQEQGTQSNQGNVFAGYSPDKSKPLGPYAGLVGIYGAAFAGLMATSLNSRGGLPHEVSTRDLLLLGVATHKLTRLITKDWVTSPFRAPFTRYDGNGGAGEVNEEPRGEGWQKAMGQLVTCPWCTGPWVAGALAFGLVLAPRPTRLIASIFVAVTMSDFLHHAYDATKKAAKGK
ncbi:DUF1360 domain-containing protein [Deinococcus peraridilitoris]|uniref:DUF1360 domain-containing protein n=1 Tax=Deinococcus peraridilitoris (strain DSM 19664 / LMG 22246 / CIP 109416 / KR-200) TaxID=937777 RepID=L0A8D8_DEIPD|nr:DUF1360 domain-containing protein [Deinococcus peraridilitoris]AFZ69689.1 Protein of unknown function (DUF1360) [Deinococcus peraridilitoris DSM 19664]